MKFGHFPDLLQVTKEFKQTGTLTADYELHGAPRCGVTGMSMIPIRPLGHLTSILGALRGLGEIW
jgi:hypothetical protein